MFARLGALIIVGLLGSACAANPPARHGVASDLKTYPQSTPKEAFEAVLKAVDLKRIDYLLAHLAEADWVDEQVKLYAGGFPDLVKETTEKMNDTAVKQLQRFLKEGDMETLETTAVVRHKTIKDRVVRFRKVEGRWFLLHSNKP